MEEFKSEHLLSKPLRTCPEHLPDCLYHTVSHRTIPLDFDTGSSDLWVPLGTGSEQFDSTSSSTYVDSGNPFSVR